ncbi:hypothetical protein [Pantanalinema sp. GBBB05]|uniref:hypothetical protein n=1 Tax=Pantanalinema sp. GBBB05 TaxID=2604139 RepID=UPI001E053B4E|nr:hypothetical protein [Pantanalinema sp. GBBB05]
MRLFTRTLACILCTILTFGWVSPVYAQPFLLDPNDRVVFRTSDEVNELGEPVFGGKGVFSCHTKVLQPYAKLFLISDGPEIVGVDAKLFGGASSEFYLREIEPNSPEATSFLNGVGYIGVFKLPGRPLSITLDGGAILDSGNSRPRLGIVTLRGWVALYGSDDGVTRRLSPYSNPQANCIYGRKNVVDALQSLDNQLKLITKKKVENDQEVAATAARIIILILNSIKPAPSY